MPIKRAELTGQRFGKLIAKEYAGLDRSGKSIWRCTCDCGNERIVRAANLQNGNTKGCGCRDPYRIDLTDNRFGMLTVLSHIETVRRNDVSYAYWSCICDCGKETIVLGGHLRSRHTKSCGCLRRDAGLISTGINAHNLKHGLNCGENIKSVVDLKEKIRIRDGYKCQKCDMTQAQNIRVYDRVLSVHHINCDKFDNVPENMATYCDSCHGAIHAELRG